MRDAAVRSVFVSCVTEKRKEERNEGRQYQRLILLDGKRDSQNRFSKERQSRAAPASATRASRIEVHSLSCGKRDSSKEKQTALQPKVPGISREGF